MVQIKEAVFAAAAVSPDQWPRDGRPEFAFVGRSNVGKSSLINCLTMRKKLAHTSNTPGRTQTINFYRVNGSLYLVDLPGYGYARVSRDTKKRWGQMIETYLTGRPVLRGVVQIVDLRHPPTADDQRMWEWLQAFGIPSLVVATKADKISRGRWLSHQRQVEKGLAVQKCVLFSAESGLGREEVWRWIRERMASPAEIGAPS